MREVEINERLNKEPIVIGVLGTIGVGKTTLSPKIAEVLGLECIEEKFTVNPFLENFYKDPWSWSFKSQVWFLIHKIGQLKEMDSGKSYIVDPALAMDKLYAKTLTKIGRMSAREYRTYNDLFDTLVDEEEIRMPDLYVWVDAKLPVIRKRIRGRGRLYEMQMLMEYPVYLAELKASVANFAHSQKNTEVIFVNANRDGFANDIYVKALAEKIKNKING